MSFDWSKERWVRQYRRESLKQRLWPVFCRGFRDYLQRHAHDDGTLLEGSDDPAGDLLRALGAHPDELELGRLFVEMLLEDEYLSLAEGRLWITNFEAAQQGLPPGERPKSNDALRAKRYRERKKTRDGALDPVTEGRDGARDEGRSEGVTDPVTGGVAQPVTASRGESKDLASGKPGESQKSNQKEREPARARAASSSQQTVTGDRDASVTPVTRRFAMTLDWQPDEQTWRGFDVAMIPRSAAQRFVLAAKQYYAGNPNDLKTHVEWTRLVVSWVNRDWNNPKNRLVEDKAEASSRPAETWQEEDWERGPAAPPPADFGRAGPGLRAAAAACLPSDSRRESGS